MLDYVFFTIYYSFNMAGVVQGHWTFDHVREILARLSLKSLTRCKSLSKQWKLEISSDKFIRFRNQLNKGIEEHKDFLREDLDGDSPQFVIFRIDSTNFDGLDLEVNIHPIKEIKILPSTLAAIDHAQVLENCRGILCYFIENLGFYQYIGIGDYIQNGNYSFVVCNPLTTECKIFSRPNQIGWKGFGFGYDYSADDYKVIYATGSPRVGKFGTKVECLSLKTGVWNTARIDIHYYFSFESQAYAHHVNGCLYWIARNYEEDYGGNVILCLDLEKEVMSEVTSLRVDEVLNKWSSCYLELLEGSLCLISYHDVVYPFDVWMMKEDPMTTTKYWIKFMTIPPTFSVTPKLLSFIKNGVLYIVSGQDSEEFFLYNPLGESVKKIVARGLDFDRDVFDENGAWEWNEGKIQHLSYEESEFNEPQVEETEVGQQSSPTQSPLTMSPPTAPTPQPPRMITKSMSSAILRKEKPWQQVYDPNTYALLVAETTCYDKA